MEFLVVIGAGSGRDQLADNHVFLQTPQVIGAAVNGGLGQHPAGFLEGSGRQPRLGGQGGLGDSHQLRTTLGGFPARVHQGPVDVPELNLVHQLRRQVIGVVGGEDAHLAQHLPHDQLNMLVVDFHPLVAVHVLHLLHQVLLRGPHPSDLAHLLGIQRAFGELFAGRDISPGPHPQPGVGGHPVLDVPVAGGFDHERPAPAFFVVDAHGPAGLGQDGLPFGGAGFEQLHHPGQAVGDVLPGHPPGMEGAHGQLGARLADGLGGHHPHRLPRLRQFAGGHAQPVGSAADAVPDLIGERRPHPHRRHRREARQLHHHLAVDEGPRRQLRPVLGAGRAAAYLAALRRPFAFPHQLPVGGRELVEPDGLAALESGVAGLADAQLVADFHVFGQHPPVDPVAQVAQHVALRVANRKFDARVLGFLLGDDDLLGHVHQAAGQVTGVGGAQGGVGEPLAGPVGGHKILQHRHPLPEVGPDGPGEDFPPVVGHQAADARDLTHLHDVAPGPGVHHHMNGVELLGAQGGLHFLGYGIGGFAPQLQQFLIPFPFRDDPLLVLLLHLLGFLLGLVEDVLLVGGGDHVVQAHGEAGAGGIGETQLLDSVQRMLHHRLVVTIHDLGYQILDVALQQGGVDQGEIGGQGLVQQGPAQRGFHKLVARHRPLGDQGADQVPELGVQPRVARHPAHAHLDRGVHLQLAQVVGHHGLRQVRKAPPGPLGAFDLLRQVIEADHHILGGGHDGVAAGRGAHVVGGQHQHPRLGLRLRGEGQMHGHLVPVEVGVEGLAHQRVNLDGLALHQQRLKSLNPQPVQGGGPVEEHRMIPYHLPQHVPHLRTLPFHHSLGRLDARRQVPVHQPLHHERLKQLQGHHLGQAALMQLQLRAHHYHRPARIVDPLPQQVLPEAASFSLQHIGQRLQRAIAGTGHRPPPAAVVKQGVHRLLQHSLLVVDDDFGRVQPQQPLQTVVAVDHPPVQVVQVGGGEPPPVQLHHGAQLGRDHRHRLQNHAFRRVLALPKRLHHFHPLAGAQAPLRGGGHQALPQLLHLLVQIHLGQQLFHRLGPHPAAEIGRIPLVHLPPQILLLHQLFGTQLPKRLEALLNQLPFLYGLLLPVLDFPFRIPARPGDIGRLGLRRLHLLHLLLQPLQPRRPPLLQLLVHDLQLGPHLLLQIGQIHQPFALVHLGDHVGREIDDLLQVLGGHVQQIPQPGGHPLEKPDVGDRGRQVDMTHPVPAHVLAGHLHVAFFAHDALEPEALVLAAVALPVLLRTENALVEEPVLLGLQTAVVNRLRLFHLPERPGPHLIGGRQANLQFIEQLAHAAPFAAIRCFPTSSSPTDGGAAPAPRPPRPAGAVNSPPASRGGKC